MFITIFKMLERLSYRQDGIINLISSAVIKLFIVRLLLSDRVLHSTQ